MRTTQRKHDGASLRQALMEASGRDLVFGHDGKAISMSGLEETAHAGIKAAMRLAHNTAVASGWYKDRKTGKPIKRNVGEVIALMHSELSEALEAYRKDLMDDKLQNRPGMEVELGDLFIRVLDTAKAMKLDLAGAIIAKNRYNQIRDDHKIENRKKRGGKKF